jgi:GSH-dependent disulfide-bond oxidoreductase
MIELYALTSPNVVKVFLMLEECALPYNTITVDVWKADQFKPEFLKINPNAKVPAIVDHEGPGGKPYTVFESGAILMYLAEKAGRFLPKDTVAKYDVLQWLMIQLTGVGPMSGQLVHFRRFAPKEHNEYSLSRYGTEVRRLYELLDGRLANSPWLGGAEYSIADIATWPWSRNHELLGLKIADYPHVGAWVDRIAARPAAQKTLAILPTIKSVRDNPKPEDVDRFFGRGKFAKV